MILSGSQESRSLMWKIEKAEGEKNTWRRETETRWQGLDVEGVNI